MAGAKMEKAKQAAMELIDQLADEDTFALVTYSAGVEILVPAQRERWSAPGSIGTLVCGRAWGGCGRRRI